MQSLMDVKAHVSQRLVGELVVFAGTASVSHCSSVVNILKDYFSEM